MTIDAIGSAIRQRFVDNWTRSEVYTFDNQGQFSDGTRDAPSKAAWVRFSILHGTAQQVEMGNSKRIRRPGVIVLQIFLPSTSGTGLAEEISDAFADIFETRTAESIVYRAMDVSRVGLQGAWLQYNASINFHKDDFRT